MSTRPRVEFDDQQICNACRWSEEKIHHIDWKGRQIELQNLVNKHKKHPSAFDCIVPVSGGKDGTYVSMQMKEKYECRPLCVTVRPPLELDIGTSNLRNYLDTGIDHIHITPNLEVMRALDTVGFKEYGQGYYGWLIAIHTAVLRIALQFGITLIMYAEDGEIEYGGSTASKYKACYGFDRMKSIYLNNTYHEIVKKASIPADDLFWFSIDDQYSSLGIQATHYSYYEAWDPYRNYLFAKEKAGLTEAEAGNIGTFTNFAQNDQELASLHYYLMYIKFGFGRATQDAGIEIRRGSMSRDQALQLVRIYDCQAPIASYDKFADYFRMTRYEFEQVLERFVNRDLFESDGCGNVRPLFTIV